MTGQETLSGAPMNDRPRVLILGGTGDGRALATEAAGNFAITYSLAGRTRDPALPDAVETRTGGFGGPDALAAWLKDKEIAAVIDATHPFAAQIAAHAEQAAAETGTPRLKLVRPAWDETAGDAWHHVPDVPAAVSLLPAIGRTAFLSIGRQEIASFADVEGVRLVIRSIDPPENADNLADAVYITGRGPFTTTQESALLREHGIDVVVSKNAGGAATYPKIAAARQAGIPVIMINRPPPPSGPVVSDVGAAIRWLEQQR